MTFCEAHWIFACYYYRVANSNPSTPKSVVSETWQKTVFWVGVAVNALVTSSEAVFGILFFANQDKQDPKPWQRWGVGASVIGSLSVQIISGSILIWSIVKIKKRMDEIKDEINIEALILHSAAFGLYMISLFVYGSFYCLYLSNFFNPKY